MAARESAGSTLAHGGCHCTRCSHPGQPNDTPSLSQICVDVGRCDIMSIYILADFRTRRCVAALSVRRTLTPPIMYSSMWRVAHADAVVCPCRRVCPANSSRGVLDQRGWLADIIRMCDGSGTCGWLRHHTTSDLVSRETWRDLQHVTFFHSRTANDYLALTGLRHPDAKEAQRARQDA